MAGIETNNISLLTKSLDYLWLRQSVTADNIANAETPGFKAGYVDFESSFKARLDAAMATGNESDISNAIVGSSARIGESTAEGTRLDGNNVNVEIEMIEITRNSLQYQYALNAVTSELSRLNAVIKGQ